jgi:hypothetical protein
MNAEQFNSLHPVGTPVVAYPLTRPEDETPEFFERLTTVTRTPARELGDGTPVIEVEGYAAGMPLAHVDVVTGGA